MFNLAWVFCVCVCANLDPANEALNIFVAPARSARRISPSWLCALLLFSLRFPRSVVRLPSSSSLSSPQWVRRVFAPFAPFAVWGGGVDFVHVQLRLRRGRGKGGEQSYLSVFVAVAELSMSKARPAATVNSVLRILNTHTHTERCTHTHTHRDAETKRHTLEKANKQTNKHGTQSSEDSTSSASQANCVRERWKGEGREPGRWRHSCHG